MRLQFRQMLISVTTVLALSALNSLSAQEIYPRPDSTDRIYEVFFIGNTGAASLQKVTPTLKLLQSKLKFAGKNSAVIFLGDLLMEGGLPDSGAIGRKEAEQRLRQLIDVVKDSKGRIVFIPGEHDWGKKKKVGWKSLIRMEKFIEKTLDRGNVFVPSQGFPGPEHIKLTDKIRLIALDTQWLLTENKKRTGDTGDYDVTEDDEFYVELEDIIMKRATKDLIIVGHHPIYSNGRYGGHFDPKAHLFPLTLDWENAYIPLPIIGTLYLAYRRNIGNEQYFSHTRNAFMRYNIDRIIREHEDYIYVSAHDYSMQLFKTRRLNAMQKYLVSGSAARSEYTAPGYEFSGSKTMFISSEKGFSSLNYYNDGSLWIDFWAVNEDGRGRRIHEVLLRGPKKVSDKADIVFEEVAYPDYSDSTIVVAPEPAYGAGWLQEFLAGSNHRDVWTTPVQVPYFDIGKEHGGLRPVKRGGGLQTTSIRLEAADGKQYVLRSINKDGRRFLPEEVQYTFVGPITQDFLSYSHPHGAFIVPSLADAVGVYHTNPKLVYVPNDARFGVYQNLVSDILMLYEERPNKDMSDSPSFGNSKDVVGASEVYRKVTNDNDFRIDAFTMARARLFDMWLSDWDRHKDQWRWASFDTPDGKGKIYKPIPRDRDQAFMKLNFFLHPIIKPFFNFQDYRESYGNLKGLTTCGLCQDHRFLNELEKDDWLAIADSVKNALSDEIIESAFCQLPEPVFLLQGEEMIQIGKVRRDKLPEVAEEFYRLHARSVDVVGSNKHERFEVTRRTDKLTEVVVYKTSKKGKIKKDLYHRIMNLDETDEICLYGLGGNDQFIIRGDVKSGITIHAVGGTGDDSFIDSSRVGGWGSKTHFYDSQESQVKTGSKTSVKITDDPRDNDYTGFFNYPRTYPLALAWYTSDDGLVLLGGILHRGHSFRKDPYARQHIITGSYATHTQAYQLSYHGNYRQTFGYDWHMGLNVDFANPDNFRNFYGLGNETKRVEDIDSVRVFLGAFNFEVPFSYEDETGWIFDAVPKVRMTNVRDDQTELSILSQPGLSDFILDPQWYIGSRLFFDFTCKDDRDNPRMGYKWPTTLDGNIGLYNAPDNYLTIESELSLYTSLWSRRQYTLAIRIGGAHNFGTFPFYASNTLGGTTNLRGYRSTRFSGRSSLYANMDLRIGLFRIGGEVLPGTLGVLGFFDIGRVWTDGEFSSKWHPGYGFDIWYDVVGELIVRFSVGYSPESTTYLVGPGFFF
jgi:hypothetical protein